VARKVLDWLMDHGRLRHDHHGAEIVYFARASREQARRARATEAIRERKNYFNTYPVVEAGGRS